MANYISEDAMKDMQIIVISLKEEFFNKVGKLEEKSSDKSSKIFSFKNCEQV